MIYISKGEWFTKGALCELIVDLRPRIDCGVFAGPRQVVDGIVDEDEEVCPFDEFTAEDGVSAEGSSWAMEGVK